MFEDHDLPSPTQSQIENYTVAAVTGIFNCSSRYIFDSPVNASVIPVQEGCLLARVSLGEKIPFSSVESAILAGTLGLSYLSLQKVNIDPMGVKNFVDESTGRKRAFVPESAYELEPVAPAIGIDFSDLEPFREVVRSERRCLFYSLQEGREKSPLPDRHALMFRVGPTLRSSKQLDNHCCSIPLANGYALDIYALTNGKINTLKCAQLNVELRELPPGLEHVVDTPESTLALANYLTGN